MGLVTKVSRISLRFYPVISVRIAQFVTLGENAVLLSKKVKIVALLTRPNSGVGKTNPTLA